MSSSFATEPESLGFKEVAAGEQQSLNQFEQRCLDQAQSEHVSARTSLSEVASNDGGSLQRMATSFFSPRLQAQRKHVWFQFLFNIFALAALTISVFSLYWGALYNRNSHLGKVRILAVIQDDGSLPGALPAIIDANPGGWHVYTSEQFQSKYHINETQVDSKIEHLVHTQKFWMSLNVKPNATNALHESLQNPSADPFVASNYFEAIYESGRDPTNFRSSILPLLQEVELSFQKNYTSSYLPELLSHTNLSNASPANLAAAGNLEFGSKDMRPFSNYVLLGPLQVGLIFCVLLTFFQLAMFGPLHGMVSPKLKPAHILIYRYCISMTAYFFLSLFFCTVSAIFQVDFTPTFGRAGFMVYWMSTWLIMAAVGGANENVLSLIIAWAPQYMGFWLVFWIVSNISPSFFPLALMNNFYRYGYMMPIHNAMDIYKVIFLNTYKGTLGRNYGILCAWVVINSILFVPVLKLVGNRMKQNAQRAAAAAATTAAAAEKA